jgi:single-stranded DNA-binding protein
MALNVLCLTGRLKAKPVLRFTQSGIPYCQFTLCVDRRRTAEESQRGDRPPADFFHCTAWRQPAEYLASYFDQGQYVELRGRVETRISQRTVYSPNSSASTPNRQPLMFVYAKGEDPKPLVINQQEVSVQVLELSRAGVRPDSLQHNEPADSEVVSDVSEAPTPTTKTQPRPRVLAGNAVEEQLFSDDDF